VTAKPEASNDEEISALHCTKALLKAGANPAIKNKWGNTLLHSAIRAEQPEIVKLLCGIADFDINVPNREGITPYNYVAYDSVEDFVDEEGNCIHGPNHAIFGEETDDEISNNRRKRKKNNQKRAHNSATTTSSAQNSLPSRSIRKRGAYGSLHSSCIERSEGAKQLLQGQIESKRARSKRYLFEALLLRAVAKDPSGDLDQIIDLLAERRKLFESQRYRIWPLDYRNNYLLTPQHVAVMYEDDSTKILQTLLDYGLDFDIPSMATGFQPVHEAANVGNAEAVQLLYRNNYNAIEENDGYSCLTLCGDHDNGHKVAQYLLRHESTEVNHHDKHGNTALHWAVFRCNIPLIKVLLKHKSIHIFCRNKWGNSPMHYAFYRAWKSLKHLECLQLLFDHGLTAHEPLNEINQAPRDVLAGYNTSKGIVVAQAAKLDDPKAAGRIIKEYLAQQQALIAANPGNGAESPNKKAKGRGRKANSSNLQRNNSNSNSNGNQKENKEEAKESPNEEVRMEEETKAEENQANGGTKHESQDNTQADNDNATNNQPPQLPPPSLNSALSVKLNGNSQPKSGLEEEISAISAMLAGDIFYSCDDISFGQENVKIPLINTIDNKPLELHYISEVVPHENVIFPVFRAATEDTARMAVSRCSCTDDCLDANKCACLNVYAAKQEKLKMDIINKTSNNKKEGNHDSENHYNNNHNSKQFDSNRAFPYNVIKERNPASSTARSTYLSANCSTIETLVECSDLCGCPPSCSNRVSERGVLVNMQIYKTPNKGWAARAMEDIPQGTFISEYVGELISEEEAQKRMREEYDVAGIHYLFAIRDSKYVLDPFRKGNVSRLYNHSCQPNITKLQVYRTHHQDASGKGGVDSIAYSSNSGDHNAVRNCPRMVFVAARDIAKGEELCISYDYEQLEHPGGCLVCYCGSSNCCYNLV
jgi:ankyrin repeat protein